MMEFVLKPLLVGSGILVAGAAIWQLAVLFPNIACAVFVGLIFLIFAWLLGLLIVGLEDTDDRHGV